MSRSGPADSLHVKNAARALGFDAAGVCDLRPVERPGLDDWLARGYAGSMRYMHRQAERRQDPATIAPGCTRAVVVLKSYYREDNIPPGNDGQRVAARVARYAWGDDYHRVVGDRLRALADALIDLGSAPEHTRCFVDAGPVPERELGQRAGLGWIAKNTMLIHPKLGSFTFIGSVFTDLELAVDEPFRPNHCGRCRRCLDACPTGAFPAERLLDSRRCISYLTIEHRGAFDAQQGPMIGEWLFGCDICQDVCPWNVKFARPTGEKRFTPRPETTRPDLRELAAIDKETFGRRYAGTAFERPGASGIARNARQVLANRRRA